MKFYVYKKRTVAFFYLFVFSSFFSLISNNHLFAKTKISNNQIKASRNVSLYKFPTWSEIREKSENSVVQLFVQVSVFNWLEPYKTPRQYETCGSGFFIDKAGHLVSNYHVVEEASGTQIQIPAFGKKRFDVEVVGVCPKRDVALLKLSQKSFDAIVKKLGRIPFLELGNSDNIRSVSNVLVLGYPLGQEKLKATKGIVSGREFLSDDPFTEGDSYLQVDAALNPGNSGGPCIDKFGKVIGINTSGYTTAQNVGYIIPINDVKNVIHELHSMRFQRKPFLGVKFGNTSSDMIKFLGNTTASGWYVSQVYKNTLLAKCGVLEGDIVVEFNGYEVDMFGEIDVEWSEGKVSIFDFFNRFPTNEAMKIVVYRRGIRKEILFKLESDKPLPVRFIYREYEKIEHEIIGGLVVMELSLNHVYKLSDYNPSLIKFYKRENQYDSKLILTHIVPNSQTQKARVLTEGDIFDEVNGSKVKTLNDFREAVKESAKSGFLSVKIASKEFMVLSVEKIIRDEDKLAKEYVFEKSRLVNYLSEKFKNNRKQNGRTI